ncbi:MAG: DUF3467 domain-containing protein [Acidiferrobacterales bacterium]
MSPIPDEKLQSEARTGGSGQTPEVRWDSSNVSCSYANVCNVTSTREEVVLNFGINQVWERNRLDVQLTNRIILTPFTAKRLRGMLDKLVNEYESHYGELKVD